MGQVLRVTVGHSDHTFKLLGMNVSARERAELEVEWAGKLLKIVRSGRSWSVEGTDSPELAEIAECIGKALALRYRF